MCIFFLERKIRTILFHKAPEEQEFGSCLAEQVQLNVFLFFFS
jgi:hypothetical protein